MSANVFTVGIDFEAHDVFIRHFRPACVFPTHAVSDGPSSGAVLAATTVPLAARNAARGRGEGRGAQASPCRSARAARRCEGEHRQCSCQASRSQVCIALAGKRGAMSSGALGFDPLPMHPFHTTRGLTVRAGLEGAGGTTGHRSSPGGAPSTVCLRARRPHVALLFI